MFGLICFIKNKKSGETVLKFNYLNHLAIEKKRLVLKTVKGEKGR
jgi:hypothetical protein